MQSDAPNSSTSPGAAGTGSASDAHGLSVATLTTRVTQALEVVARDETNNPSLRTEMRHAVSALTLALRRSGQPPEKVVIAVKALTRGVLLTLEETDGSTSGRQLLDDVVTTCVEAYYPQAPRAD